MRRLVELHQTFNKTKERLIQLEVDYKDKKKGNVYTKQKSILTQKLNDTTESMKGLGKNAIICIVSGVYKRNHKKNPSIRVNQNFKIYFVNVTQDEVPFLLKLNIKYKIVKYTTTFIQAGEII